MKIHFIGNCGCSMRALALLAKGFNCDVSGSDILNGGHRASNVVGKELVVFTSAIKSDNPEILEAKRLGIPLMKRSVFLKELSARFSSVISVAGSHGKTTTTAMAFEAIKSENPTLHLGGKYHGEYGHFGGLKYFITEACEYRRSFLSLSSGVGIITNIELDHTDYYRDLDDLLLAFNEFSLKCDTLIINGDDDNCKKIIAKNRITFGQRDGCDYRALDVRFNGFSSSFALLERGRFIGRFKINVPSCHNVYNALAAIALARTLGVNEKIIMENIALFKGVDRRFERVGKVNNMEVIIDYAHHPSEIENVIKAARICGYKKVAVVFEPHTYSRLKSLQDGFVQALSSCDKLIITKVFASREAPIEGVSGYNLFLEVRKVAASAVYLDTYSAIVDYVLTSVKDCDVLLVLGAGSVNKVAKEILDRPLKGNYD